MSELVRASHLAGEVIRRAKGVTFDPHTGVWEAPTFGERGKDALSLFCFLFSRHQYTTFRVLRVLMNPED
jgi:hypothetical protein